MKSMKPKHKRFVWIMVAALILAGAVSLALAALRENILYFYYPKQLAQLETWPKSKIRLGGLVKKGTLEKVDQTTIRFLITDAHAVVPVVFSGALPDLFREGQGVIAEGVLENGTLKADQVLAKHDETYMPPNSDEALIKLRESQQ